MIPSVLDVEDALRILKKIKLNLYGIKYSSHSIVWLADGLLDMNLVNEKICNEKPVGIEKDANSSTGFLVLYEMNKFKDLAIAIDILDEDEILINLLE